MQMQAYLDAPLHVNIDHNNDEQHVQHEQYESNNIVLNEPFLDQALVTQVPTPEPRLLATLELPLAGRSFSTDSRGAALELPLAGRSFSSNSRGAALELPLAGRSFSTDSLSSLKDGRPALVCKMDGQPLSVRFLPYQHL